MNYIKFSNPEDVEKWVSKNYTDELLSKFDVTKDNILTEYKGGCYATINELLRKGIDCCKEYDIKCLQSMLLQCNIPDNITAYRYVCKKEMLSLKRGTRHEQAYICPQFLSTTLLPECYKMEDIKRGKKPITVLIPKGTNGMYIPEVNNNLPEFEVLLPHHMKLKRINKNCYIVVGQTENSGD